MAQLPTAHLYMMDTPRKRASSKGLAGGGYLSRAQRAQALQHLVPLVLQLPAVGAGGPRGTGRGTGGAVTARSCASLTL